MVLDSVSPFTLFNVQQPSTGVDLTSAYMRHAEKQIQKQQQAIADRTQVEIDAAGREMQRWTPLTGDIEKAQGNVSAALGAIDNIDKILLKMTGALYNKDADWAAAASTFDALFMSLNGSSDDRDTENLIGTIRRGDTYSANEVSYQASPDPRDQVTVHGRYLGSDAKIVQADGTFWLPDSMQRIQQYTAYPHGEVGYPQSTSSSAISLDAPFDESAIKFTVGKHLATPQSYQGSLDRRGLGVLQSWLYDGLATVDGRARALDDIRQARTLLKDAKSTFEATQTQVNGDLANVQSHIDEQQMEIARLSDLAQQSLQTYVTEAKAQAERMANLAGNVDTLPVVQLLRVGGRIGNLFDLMV